MNVTTNDATNEQIFLLISFSFFVGVPVTNQNVFQGIRNLRNKV